MNAFSIGEMKALVAKAAHGAGLPWGLAQEAAAAASWLACRDLTGVKAVGGLLALNDGRPYGSLAPVNTNGAWRSRDGFLCPIVTGCCISDRAGDLLSEGRLRIGPINYPLLLFYSIAAAAEIARTPLSIHWAGVDAVCTPQNVVFRSGEGRVGASEAEQVVIERAPGPEGPARTKLSRCAMDGVLLAHLERLAGRTYAPATEWSRLSGAGAGAGVADAD